MSVIVERNGPVTTLVIARPERRNAVDRPTAQALADALREFEADDTARVAVLIGSGGNFALAAARALYENTDLPAAEIAGKALRIASDICVYTNSNIIVETV